MSFPKPVRSALFAAIPLLLSGIPAGAAPFLDDFTTDSSANYVESNVLFGTATSGDPQYAIDSGNSNELDHTVSGFSGGSAIQSLYLHQTAGLAIGETVVLDVVSTNAGGNEQIGVAVSLTGDPPDASPAPPSTDSQRTDLFTAGYRPGNGSLDFVAERFDGTTDLTQVEADLDAGTLASLYITRNSATEFVSGWIDSSDTYHEVGSFTGSNFTAAAAFIGIYSDIRSGGYSATVDNLRVLAAPPVETVLFADNFNAANGGYDSADTTGRLSGILVGETYMVSFGTTQDIVGNQLALDSIGGTPGAGLYFELETNDPVSGPADRYDWAGGTAASTILTGGGFRISYDWTPGNASNTEWHAWSFGTSNSNSSDSSRVNNPDVDYGILIRQNGGSQRFDGGSSLGNGISVSTSSGVSYPVTIDLGFTSFADGTTVTAVTTINGTEVADDSFTWNGNGGAIRFEVGCNVDGHLIDNLSISAEGPPPAAVYAIDLTGNAFGGNDPVGTTVGTLSATLNNVAQTSTFALVAGTGDDDNGLFLIDGDQLEVATDFSGPGYVDGQTFSVRIEGTSSGGGGETDAQAYTLTLHKEDDPGTPPSFPPGAAAPGAPTDLRVDDTVDPVGTSDTPYFGWHVNDTDPNEIQTAWQILAATSAANLAADNGDLWDSGQVSDDAQNHVTYAGAALASDQLVHWKVRTWDRDGNVSPYSAPATFVVGLNQNGDWTGAEWIRRNSSDDDRYTYFRHTTGTLPDKTVERATVYVSAAHKYALYLNDTLVGKGPAYHYPEYQYYNAYDITALVQANEENQFAIFHHWFGGGQGRPANASGVIMKAVVHYTDDSTTVIGTDGTWLQTQATAWVTGQSQRNSGEGVGYIEFIDARELTPDWFTAAFDDSSWGNPVALGSPPTSPWSGTLAPDLTRIVETEVTVEPAAITLLSGNRYVVDLGRVRSGVPRIEFSGGSSGGVVLMKGGYELTVSGAIDTTMNQNTDMSFRAYLNGGTFTYEPAEYLGMRYFQIDSPPMPVTSANFTFIERHSEMDVSGSSFDSSDTTLNAVWDLMKQSLLTCAQEAFVDTPTREKGGFLGDAAIQSIVAMPVMNERKLTRRSLHEFIQSMDQHWSGTGRMNAVYPNGDGARDIPDYTQAYLPWVWSYYLETGDRDFLADNYAKFEEIANYVHAHEDGGTGLVTSLTGGSGAYLNGIIDWPATMRFGYDMSKAAKTVINGWALADYDVMAKISSELGNTTARNVWWGRHDALESAMNTQLINGSGHYVDGLGSANVSQHANMFPLALGTVPAANQASVTAKVKELEMSVGMVTLPWLVRAIGEAEEGEHLMDLFTDNSWTYGYADILSKGATCTWESWDADTTGQSLSHGWGAAGLEGYLRYILGVKPLEAQCAEVEIKPLDFGTALDRAEGTMATDRGDVMVKWERSTDTYRMEVTLPVNILATIAVPKGPSTSPKVLVDGFEVTGTIEGDFIRVPWVGSGDHTIVRVDETVSLKDAWRADHFGIDWQSDPDSDDDADPDGDGLTNRVEYALGFDPLVPSNHLLPQAEVQGQDLTIAYPTPRSEITYSIRGTENLNLDPANWDTLTTTTEVINGVTHLRATVSTLVHELYFIRLMMQEP